MLRENIVDLMSFMMVARESSFTRAAAKVGVSQSALSHSVRGLEERLGVRLLNRTTRKVTPTRLGEQVLDRLEPHLGEMERELARILERKDRPAGTIRISASRHAEAAVLWPKLAPVLKTYPDLQVEIVGDESPAEGSAPVIDAWVSLGEQIDEETVAVRISPDFRMLAVASPGYLETRKPPEKPQDLSQHACISFRLPAQGGLPVWTFGNGARETRVRVEGQLTFDTIDHVVDAAMAGYGIGHVPEGLAGQALADGRLVTVLEDWCPPRPGYFLYYPLRRKDSPAFGVLADALRHAS